MSELDLSTRRVKGGYFLNVTPHSQPYQWPAPDNASYSFLGTYRGSGSPVRDALVEMIGRAKHRVFVASFVLGDDALVIAMLEAAERLRGGVYLITALDARTLARGMRELDEYDHAKPEEQRKCFERLTAGGVYVRGHESCHAKFAVVDDEVALVGSANFDQRGFEVTNEADICIRDPEQVRQTARLFTELWYEGCTWEVPPGEHYQVAERHPTPPPARPVPPNDEPDGLIWTNGADRTSLLNTIHRTIGSAKDHLLLATFSIVGMLDASNEHLLMAPLREALDRGVKTRLFIRQQNPRPYQSDQLCQLYDLGVEILGDSKNHAKVAIADDKVACIFSANFDAQHGLDRGVEIGFQLRQQPALGNVINYMNHLIAETDTRFVRNPTAGELDGNLAARWCETWRGPPDVHIRCTPEVESLFMTNAQSGPVLFKRENQHTRLFAGQQCFALSKVPSGEHFSLEMIPGDPVVPVEDQLRSWLDLLRTAGNKKIEKRGFCPALIRFDRA